MPSESQSILFVGKQAAWIKPLRALYSSVSDQLVAVVTVDDSHDLRSNLKEFEEFCQNNHLPIFVLEKPTDLKNVIQQFTPSAVLVVGWYWIISSKLLSLVPNGFFGVHASLLPRYRGNAPLVWAILRGENESGVTLFRFDSGIDSGQVVGQGRFSIDLSDTIADVLMKAEKETLRLIKEFAHPIMQGTAKLYEQDHKAASLFPSASLSMD